MGIGRHSSFAGVPFLDQSEMFTLLTGCASLQEVEGGDAFESGQHELRRKFQASLDYIVRQCP